MELKNQLFKSILKEKIKQLQLNHREVDFLESSRFSTDENGDFFDFSNDVFFHRILEKGDLKLLSNNEEGIVLDMPYGLCHENSLFFLDSEEYDGEDIYTGFALNDANEWFIHTYFMKDNTITETTSDLFIAYFGFKLSSTEISEMRIYSTI